MPGVCWFHLCPFPAGWFLKAASRASLEDDDGDTTRSLSRHWLRYHRGRDFRLTLDGICVVQWWWQDLNGVGSGSISRRIVNFVKVEFFAVYKKDPLESSAAVTISLITGMRIPCLCVFFSLSFLFLCCSLVPKWDDVSRREWRKWRLIVCFCVCCKGGITLISDYCIVRIMPWFVVSSKSWSVAAGIPYKLVDLTTQSKSFICCAIVPCLYDVSRLPHTTKSIRFRTTIIERLF